MTDPIESEIIYREILEQPAIAIARAQAAPPTWPTGGGRLLVAGSGDSLCAAEAVARTWPGLGAVALDSMDASAAALTMAAATR